MYKILPFFLLSLVISNASAQVDSLGKPNNLERASISTTLYDLEDFLNKYAQQESDENRKTAVAKLMKEAVENNKVTLPNDLGKSDKKELQFMEYAKQLSAASSGKWSIKLSDFTPYQMAFDKLRKKNFLIVKATKTTTIESIEAGTGDTLEEEIVQPWLFYLRFDRIQNVSSHFRIFAVAKPGEEFTIEPLAEEVVWWLGLDKNWKDYLRKGYKLPEYPSQVELLHLLNRSSLSLEGQTFFTDLSILNNFKKLEVLNLRNSSVKDLNQLKQLEFLHELYLDGSKITSLQGIEGLTRLRKIYASKMGITSMEPLRKLVLLEELFLAENDIEDISPLEKMANLKKLDLSLNTKVRDVQVLAKLYALQELLLAKIDIKDLSILKQMDQLYKLNVFNTGITTLEPLRNLTKLSTLDCSFNVVSSLEPLSGMMFMQNLSIGGTAVTDLNVLGNFKFLERLDCSNNPRLTSLGPVINLDEVKELKCFYTKIDKNEVQQFKRKHVRCRITYY